MQYYIHPEDESGGLATEASADREYARNVGYDNPDRAWILSNRDAWYANPFYSGPKVPHPEDDSDFYQEEWEERMVAVQDDLESQGAVYDRFYPDNAFDGEIPY